MDKRQHIIETAQELFARYGPKKVTTDDIAREGRKSKATLYKHFRNKGEIFDAVVQAEADDLIKAIEDEVNLQSSAIDKLRAHLMTRLQRVHEFANLFHVTQESWGENWPPIASVRKSFFAREKKIVQGILDDGIKSGEIVCEESSLVAHVLIVALASLEYQWSLDERQVSLEQLVDTMLNMMSQGILRK